MTAFPSTQILDDFNRANEGPPPSASWTTMLSADCGDVVSSNQVAQADVGWAGSAWNVQPSTVDCDVAIFIPTRPGDGYFAGVLARVDLSANVGYGCTVLRNDTSGDTVRVESFAGVGEIANYSVILEDGDGVGIRCDGDTIQAWYYKVATGWLSLGTTTNSDTPDIGYVGICSNDDTGAVRLENFMGGDYTIVPPAWTDAQKSINHLLEVDWDKDGTFTDESANLLAEGGATGHKAMLMPWQIYGSTNAQEPWTATFQMKNVDDRYSAANASSPLYADIATNKGHGIPIRFSVGIDDGAGGYTYTRLFTGVIDQLNVSSTTHDLATIMAVDNAQPLLQSRKTTTMYLDELADTWLTVLATEGDVAATSLDPGRCVIPFAWLDDEQLWAEMNKTAHCDGGLVYFNNSGTLVFENSETWITLARHTTSQYTFTVSRWEDMAPGFLWDNVYNEVIAQYQPRALANRQEVWKLEQLDRRILPGEVRTITARLRYPCAAIFTPVANTDFHILSDNGDDLTADVTVTDFTAYAQRVEIEVTNANASRAAYIFDFKLRGVPLMGYPAGQVKYQATDSDIGNPVNAGAKTFTVSGNEYLQTLDQGQLIAASLRDRVKKTRLTYHITNVPGIPTLIPGDRVTVVEAGSGVNTEGFITSIDWQYAKGSFDFTACNVLDATSWTPYSASEYFILGTDVLAASDSKRVFY